METNQFEIKRDGVIAKDYKPKVIKKRIIVSIQAVGRYFTGLAYKLASYVAKGIIQACKDVKTSIVLDAMDYKYNTNLRAQYMSGRRTQAILAAKRQHGLI